MVKIKELLSGRRRIQIIVETSEHKQFLEYVKSEGCLWDTGEIIKPNLVKPTYTNRFVITSDLLMYQPCNFISIMSLQNDPKILFKDIKSVADEDNSNEKLSRIIRYDQNYKDVWEAKNRAKENRCKENRKINSIQLKYKNIVSKLPNNFFVRYTNDDELLRLFLLFKKYGYENLYSIDLDNFSKDPKVIFVDNLNMIYSPANLSDCSCGLNANKKFHETTDFEKMMTNIFA